MSRYADLLSLEKSIQAAVAGPCELLLNGALDTLKSVALQLARERITGKDALASYEKALEIDKNRIRLQDGSRWALRLELGGPSIDMRTYMLRGGQTARNVPMDRSMSSAKAYASHSANTPQWFPSSIHAFLQHQIKTIMSVHDESGRTRLVASKEGQRMPAGTVLKIKDGHVADPFARMVKMAQSYEKKTDTSGLRIWRRISENGRGVTWMQPEQKSLHILSDAVRSPEYLKVAASVRPEMAKVVVQAIREALNG